ncbi:uncharacterized protein LOC103969956 isoform X4 [Musa acuminata AAA Group]|uniref:uncharacterized protein LOC103969956 isoform X4 n=1 Tax=Musa acuminata AAA Group TaxID=214697 RepID=UPI0031D99190
MTPNEQTKGSVPGDGGLRMGKKNKQKKIPQRGLGVAQLEKLRLEEQQKKGASSSSDPSTQGFGFPPPPPPPQQQQQPYFPLATDEGVMRPRVALVVPVNSYPVISMPPPRPVAQDTSMPVLWNAGDPNACDGEAFAKSFGFHVPPGSDLSNTSCRSRTPMTLANMASPASSVEPPSNQTTSHSYDLLSCWREREREREKERAREAAMSVLPRRHLQSNSLPL